MTRTATDPAATPARHAATPAPGPRRPDTISASPATGRHARNAGAGWITFHPAGLMPGYPVFLTAAERAALAAWLTDTSRTDAIEVGK